MIYVFLYLLARTRFGTSSHTHTHRIFADIPRSCARARPKGHSYALALAHTHTRPITAPIRTHHAIYAHRPFHRPGPGPGVYGCAKLGARARTRARALEYCVSHKYQRSLARFTSSMAIHNPHTPRLRLARKSSWATTGRRRCRHMRWPWRHAVAAAAAHSVRVFCVCACVNCMVDAAMLRCVKDVATSFAYKLAAAAAASCGGGGDRNDTEAHW